MKLGDVEGLVEPPALQWLFDHAAEVPIDRAIVELGSYSGQSASWIAAGSRSGNGSHLTCVDIWAGPGWPGAMPPGEAFLSFIRVLRELKLEGYVTPLRTTTVGVAQIWVRPIGLLFIDADHEYPGVFSDCEHWLPHLAVGGRIAMHDYNLPGVAKVIDDILAPSGAFSEIEVVEGTNMWTAKLDRPW